MSFAPGEAYQFDWSHETITLQNLPLMVKAAHMKLSHSRMPFVRVYFRETQELVFDAHDKAFGFYGGVCRRGIYDSEGGKQSIRWIDCRPNEDGGGSDLRRQGAQI
jgi:transposase